MQNLRTLIGAILDKADSLLTSEPARMIGYGAAVLVYLVAYAIGQIKPGLIPVVSFDESVGLAFSAIATLVILVESIRRFVYSPLTYIEDLSDESEAAHEAAHLEEEFARWQAAVAARQEQAQQAPATQTITVGSAQAEGTTGKAN